MTDNPTIEARFLSYRHVAGRGVLQLTVEVPAEQSLQALTMLGTPAPGTDICLGIVRIKPPSERDFLPPITPGKVTYVGDKLKRSWHELSGREQAVLACKDKAFQKWFGIMNEDEVKKKILLDLGFDYNDVMDNKISRNVIDEDAETLEDWHKLYAQFLKETGRMAEVRS